jgi:hypothetical protein
MSEWIKTKDGLPINYQDVIIWGGNYMILAWRDGDEWNSWNDDFEDEDITHWHPLPEPPKD